MELCFVQLIEVIHNQQFVMDSVDNALRCFQVRWQQTPGDDFELSATRQFDLIFVDNVRGIIHFSWLDCALLDICKDAPRRQ